MAVKLAVQTVFNALDRITGPMAGMAKNTERHAARMRRAGEGIGASWGKLRGIISGAVVALTTGMAAKAITDFASRGDEISDVSKRIGMSTEALQEFQYAAKLADLTSEDLTSVLQKMNNSMGQLRTGTGSLYTYLKATNPQLALQLKHTNNSEKAFTMLMEAIAKEGNTAKRAALAQAAFGKAGQPIIDMAADLNEKRAEARASGTIISAEDVRSAAEMHVNLLRMQASGRGLLNNFLGRAVRILGPLVDKFNAWYQINKDIINQKIDNAINWIVRAVRTAYDIFTRWWPVIRDVGIAIVALNVALKAFAIASAIGRGVSIASAAFELFTKGARAATVAQIALNMAQKQGMLGGVGGKIVQGAITAAAGGGLAGAAGMAAAVVAPAAVLGAVYYGASQYAKNATPEALNPNNALLGAGTKERMAASPVSSQMAAIMTPALAAALNSQKSKLDITLNGFPVGTSTKVSGSGAPGIGVNLGPTLAGLQ